MIDPALPIIDPHHHPSGTATAAICSTNLLDDTESGRNIRATVYIQCRPMFRADGPVELQPIGRNRVRQRRVAAMSASGFHYGDMLRPRRRDHQLRGSRARSGVRMVLGIPRAAGGRQGHTVLNLLG